MNDISWGCARKMEFLEGKRGPFRELILKNPQGMGGHEKNPFHGECGHFLELHNYSRFACDVIIF